MFAEVAEIATNADPNVVKLRKAAQETDPSLRTYGEQMAQKVLALCDKYDSLKPTLASMTDKINDGKFWLRISVRYVCLCVFACVLCAVNTIEYICALCVCVCVCVCALCCEHD
jgi:hypothetical protein